MSPSMWYVTGRNAEGALLWRVVLAGNDDPQLRETARRWAKNMGQPVADALTVRRATNLEMPAQT